MKKIILNSNPYILKNDDYSTITIDLMYPCSYEKEHIFDNELFSQIVMNSSYDYNTEQEFKKEKLKRLIIDFSLKKIKYHNNLFLNFSLTIPDPKKVKDYNFDDAIQFFFRTIYFPNIENEEFSNKQFEREKEYIKFNLQNSLKKIYNYSYQRFIKIVDDVGDLKDNMVNNLDLIEKSNPKNLYEYYKDIILNNTPLCFVYGDIEEEKIKKHYNKYIKNNKPQIIINKDYDCYMKPSKETNVIEEVSQFNQSALYMAYKIENMQEDDKIFLILLCNILNNSSINLIFKKLRTENNLIYSHDFSRYSRYGMFFIAAFIAKENKEKTINVIKNLLEEIKNEKLIEECIKKITKKNEYQLIELKDSKYYEFDKNIDSLLEFDISLEELNEKFKNIDIKEFIKFLDKVKLDTIYFLRGEVNETK